jgi:hypothetical protein
VQPNNFVCRATKQFGVVQPKIFVLFNQKICVVPTNFCHLAQKEAFQFVLSGQILYCPTKFSVVRHQICV